MKKGLLCILAVLLLIIPVMPAMAVELSSGNDANFEHIFSGIDGGDISTQSNGKSKVLIFFSTQCGNCKEVMRRISQSGWIKEGELADVCAIEVRYGTTAEEVDSFRTTYCQGADGMIQFGLGIGIGMQANNVMFQYADAAGLADGGTTTTPIIAMVDAENKLRYVTSGLTTAEDIEEKLNAMKSGDDDSQDPDDTQDPDDGQDPGDTQDPDDDQDPGDTQDPDDGQDPDDTQDPDDGQDPDDTQDPDDGQNPDDTQNPDSTLKPEVKPGKEELDKKKSKDDKPSCNHIAVESSIISGATGTSDAVVAYQCVKCGAILSYEAVSNSAYIAFLDDTVQAILNTQKNEVVINTDIWVSFSRSVFDAIKSRPDVAVTVNYVYEGKPYVLQIPAGTDVSLLMDENGFGGFRYIEQVLNAKA